MAHIGWISTGTTGRREVELEVVWPVTAAVLVSAFGGKPCFTWHYHCCYGADGWCPWKYIYIFQNLVYHHLMGSLHEKQHSTGLRVVQIPSFHTHSYYNIYYYFGHVGVTEWDRNGYILESTLHPSPVLTADNVSPWVSHIWRTANSYSEDHFSVYDGNKLELLLMMMMGLCIVILEVIRTASRRWR
jgi:hypothetical protein